MSEELSGLVLPKELDGYTKNDLICSDSIKDVSLWSTLRLSMEDGELKSGVEFSVKYGIRSTIKSSIKYGVRSITTSNLNIALQEYNKLRDRKTLLLCNSL